MSDAEPSGATQVDPMKEYRGPFAMVLAAGFMTLLDVSIVNVALPSIETAIGAGSDELQWIVAGYALTFGLMLILAGRAGDIFGRRRLFLWGLTAFVLASLGCGLAPNAAWLITLRLLQGAAAGVLNPQVLGLIQDMFRGKDRARAFGIFGIVVGVSTALGPVIGGSLIALAGAQHGWRLVFLINVPIGLVVIPLAAKWLPRHKFTTSEEHGSLLSRFDPVGILLLGAIVLTIMWPFLSQSGEAHKPSTGSSSYWLLAVSAGLVVVLLLWEKYWRGSGRSALIQPVLYKDSSFVLGLTAMFFYFGGFTSFFLVLTLYLQQGLKWSALAAGLAVVPFALVSGMTSGISGRLVNRFGRTVPLVGSSLVMVGALGMAACAQWLPSHLAPGGIIAAMTFAGTGSGLFISPNQALTLANIQPVSAGLAAALLQTFQRLGTAIGLSIVTTIYFVNAISKRSGGSLASAHAHALALACVAIAVGVAAAVCANIVDAVRRTKEPSGSAKVLAELRGAAKHGDAGRSADGSGTRNPGEGSALKN